MTIIPTTSSKLTIYTPMKHGLFRLTHTATCAIKSKTIQYIVIVNNYYSRKFNVVVGNLDPAIEISGVTEPFEGNGRKFDYPTANIRVSTDLAEGVYFGYADLDQYKNHPALIFIGTPVTVGATEHRVEAHLLDIEDRDYYSQTLHLSIHHFHRPNQHFDSVEELLSIMSSDEAAAREWMNKAANSHRS